MASAPRFTSTPEPLPMTSGMIVTPGATPAVPSPLPARPPIPVPAPPADHAGNAGAVLAVGTVVDVGRVGREVPAVAVARLAVPVGVGRAAGLGRVGPQCAGELGVVGVVTGVDQRHDPAVAGAAGPA